MRARVVIAALLLANGSVFAVPGNAQTEIGADLGIFSSYIWRGLSRTNRPVAQPAVYLSIPVGSVSVTVGGWTNIDLGRYDDLDEISESGGSSSFNLSEFQPYAEVSFPLGKATLTGGVVGYLYPNDVTAPGSFGLRTSDYNTLELYGKLGLDAPLSPELSVYYDVDKVDGAYIEGGLSYTLVASERVSFDLGVLAGLSVGQSVSDEIDLDDFFAPYADDGLTHVDVSAGVPFTAGPVFITPVIHLVLDIDDYTKFTSPRDQNDLKLWGGVSLSWSRALGPEPPGAEEAQP